MIDHKFIDFFQDLSINNNKEWFHANKKAFENDVKTPFINLLSELISKLQNLDPSIDTRPQKALFRINRDIRFSKDKSPYHLIMKAAISTNEDKKVSPAYYLGIDAENIHYGGGLFRLDTSGIKKMRTFIAHKPTALNDIVTNKNFTEFFGQLQGERNVRLAPIFQQVQPITPYIANKQFYAMKKLPVEDYLGSEELAKIIFKGFRNIHPLIQFLKKASL